MVRYTEIEKERSRRRQKVLMGSGGMWGGTLKLQMVNAGVIPIKKGTKELRNRDEEGKESSLSLCPFFRRNSLMSAVL